MPLEVRSRRLQAGEFVQEPKHRVAVVAMPLGRVDVRLIIARSERREERRRRLWCGRPEQFRTRKLQESLDKSILRMLERQVGGRRVESMGAVAELH